jgi:hypothetical protein
MKRMILTAMMMMMMVVATYADETSPPVEATAEQAIAVARLRTQDRMFALMMATYFEVQQDQIERTYERRLKVGSGEDKDGLGLVVYSQLKLEQYLPNAYRMLVTKERELKMARMARSMTDLLDLYQSSRLIEQKQIGMSIPSAVDLETATKQVKQLLSGRLDRPRDPRLWAEHETDVKQAAIPVDRKDKPAVEAAVQRLLDAERKAQAARAEAQSLGLVGTALFGLPMLKTPLVSRP